MQPVSAFLKTNLTATAWTLVALADLAAVLIWGQIIGWEFSGLSTYTIFPLLGLVAFSTMWAQYAVGGIRRIAGGNDSDLGAFNNASGYLVTLAILLHPTLLLWQLWRDGLGLPPGSLGKYVASSLIWALLLGVVSFFIFMSFELRHRYSGRSWWKYINLANDVAIVAIYIHALELGSHTRLDWFYPVWIFYGVTLGIALIIKYGKRT